MLAVPKKQVDRLEDLPDADYSALMATVKKTMRRLVEVYGQEYRACVKVIGFDVPHAHVHIKPCRDTQDFFARADPTSQPDHATLAEVAKKLAF
jgi:histidine triad (HIT) family protein